MPGLTVRLRKCERCRAANCRTQGHCQPEARFESGIQRMGNHSMHLSDFSFDSRCFSRRPAALPGRAVIRLEFQIRAIPSPSSNPEVPHLRRQAIKGPAPQPASFATKKATPSLGRLGFCAKVRKPRTLMKCVVTVSNRSDAQELEGPAPASRETRISTNHRCPVPHV